MTDFATHYASIQTAPRTVIAYHGCTRDAADHIFAERRFVPSTKSFDWLGEGIYFWEYAPYRALDWATERSERSGETPVVIRATIKLGRCLNLLDIEHIPALSDLYAAFVALRGRAGMPRNTDLGAHFLDRQIIDAYCRGSARNTARPLQTVRGSFAEGEPIYPGSKIYQKAHAQIAVRDPTCILRAALVQFP